MPLIFRSVVVLLVFALLAQGAAAVTTEDFNKRFIISGGYSETIKWEPARFSTPLLKYQFYTTEVLYYPTGSRVIFMGGSVVSIRDSFTFAEVANFTIEFDESDPYGRIFAGALSPDGSRIAVCTDDLNARIYDARTFALIFKFKTGTFDWCSSINFSPDGKKIAIAGDEKWSGGIIEVFDAVGGNSTPLLKFTGHGSSVTEVVFSPDGTRLASSSYDRTIKVWNALGQGSGTPLFTLTGHSSGVESVRYSPNGQKLVSGSFDRSVKIWNAINLGSALYTMTGHTDWVRNVAFSPDGLQVASSSDDSTLMLWDAGRSATSPLQTLRGHTNDIFSFAFDPSGF